MGKFMENIADKTIKFSKEKWHSTTSTALRNINKKVEEFLIKLEYSNNKSQYLVNLFTTYKNKIKKLSIAIVVLFGIAVLGFILLAATKFVPIVAVALIATLGWFIVTFRTIIPIGEILKFQENFEKMLELTAESEEDAKLFGKPNAMLIPGVWIPGLSFLIVKALDRNIQIASHTRFSDDIDNEYNDQYQNTNQTQISNQQYQQNLVANNSLALSLKKQNLIKENTIKFFIATKNDKPLIQVIGNQIDEETIEVKFFKLSEYISDNDYGDITTEQIIKDGFNNFYNFNLSKQIIGDLGGLHFQNILNRATDSEGRLSCEDEQVYFNPTFEKYTLQNDSDFPSSITYTFKKDKNFIINNEPTDIIKRFLFSLITYFLAIHDLVDDSILLKTNDQFVNKILANQKVLYGKNIPYNKYSDLSKDILPWTDDGRLFTKQKQVVNNVQQHNQQHNQQRYQNNQVNVNNNQNKFNPKKLLWIIPVYLLLQVVVAVIVLWQLGIF